jgi:hypothetical protein
MVIGTGKRLSRFSQDITMSFDGEVIKQVNSKKTFGVIIDGNLCWEKALSCYAKLNHLFKLEPSPISIKL